MDLQIRKGTMQDVEEMGQLYDAVNDYLADHVNYPGWRKGIYPTREDAVRGINEGCLYVAAKGLKIAGSMILRHEPEKAYYTLSWKRDISYDKVFVIYTFAVHPAYLNQNIGSQLLEFAEETALECGVESLRLDVYEGNLPAISLYEKNGFEYIGTVDLGLEEFGLKWFRLYEKTAVRA